MYRSTPVWKLTPRSTPLDGRLIGSTPGRKRLRLMYAIQRGFDYLNPEACRRLLDVVHGSFEKRVGRFFGSAIVGSFQDELPTMLTWGASFADAFQRIKGYDLRAHLAALWEGEGDPFEQVRVDYHQVRAQLAEQAFFIPLFEWHRKHGLICGFDQQGPARAGQPIGCVQLSADYLRTHRWYDAPGSDHHGHAKIHSSLAHLYERPRVWIESFHSSGWGGLEDLRLAAAWLPGKALRPHGLLQRRLVGMSLLDLLAAAIGGTIHLTSAVAVCASSRPGDARVRYWLALSTRQCR
jgi:hypothetical protein